MPSARFATTLKRQLANRIDPSAFGEPATEKRSLIGRQDTWVVERPSSERISWHFVVDPVANIGTAPHANIFWGGHDWLRRIAPANVSVLWCPAPAAVPDDPLARSLDQSLWILELPDNWDDEGSIHYERATWERARDFLLSLAREARYCSARALPAPAINPAYAGSIDLFWDLEQRQLLVNIPADPTEAITFYGEDDFGTVVSGKRLTIEEASNERRVQAEYLVPWLVARG